MNIYAFYEPIDGYDHDDQKSLINIWKKSWSYYGWNPIVYGIKECQSCEGYDEYYKLCESYPTINPKQYEMLCFLRWLYMSEVGGWYADLDMINYGFYPLECGDKIVTTTPVLNCSAIHMPKNKYKDLISIIKSLKSDGNTFWDYYDINIKVPHLSDTYVLSEYSKNIDIGLNIEVEYPNHLYDVSLIVHYPFAMYSPLYSNKNIIGKTRSQIILEDPRTKIFMS
jgi:hypothetical protein